jgi:hypothetical protein
MPNCDSQSRGTEREWLVAVDIDYYPWQWIVTATTAEEAIKKAGVSRWARGEDGAVVFVAPMDSVSVFGSQQRVEDAKRWGDDAAKRGGDTTP